MKKIASILTYLFLVCLIASKADAQISVGISVRIAPPALPVYVQPACPTEGYLWVPGYWAYDDAQGGYYWVPGVWVAPPNPGLLWTPAYWGYENGYYGFHAGYWGPHVGFYGGINYGYGYGGSGFVGGEWRGGRFNYNTAVVSVNTTVVHNTYVNRTVINNTTINNRTSFNGPGGVSAQPRPEERAAMNERHFQPTSDQNSHQQMASHDRNQFASVNNGRPAAGAVGTVSARPFSTRATPATNPGQPRGFGGNNRQNQPAGFGRPAEQQHVQQQQQPQQHVQQQPQQQRFQPQPQLQHNQPQARPQQNRSGFGKPAHHR